MKARIWLLAALCLTAPALAGPAQDQEKTQAAKVAKKLEKARSTAHQAKEEQEALREFQDEVADYAAFHDKQLAKLGPHVVSNATEAVAAQKALALVIAEKRVKARPGDLFAPEIEPLFRRLIAEQLNGPDAASARKAVLEGNPEEEEEDEGAPVHVELKINTEYPSGAARSTVPPSVLLTLPPLPACLHYRFVGRDLILIDSVAQIIVDFLPDAAPDLLVK